MIGIMTMMLKDTDDIVIYITIWLWGWQWFGSGDEMQDDGWWFVMGNADDIAADQSNRVQSFELH